MREAQKGTHGHDHSGHPEFNGNDPAGGQTEPAICKRHRDGLESSQKREVLGEKTHNLLSTCFPQQRSLPTGGHLHVRPAASRRFHTLIPRICGHNEIIAIPEDRAVSLHALNAANQVRLTQLLEPLRQASSSWQRQRGSKCCCRFEDGRFSSQGMQVALRS